MTRRSVVSVFTPLRVWEQRAERAVLVWSDAFGAQISVVAQSPSREMLVSPATARYQRWSAPWRPRTRRRRSERKTGNKRADVATVAEPESPTVVRSERKTRGTRAEVVTARLVQDERGWLRLAG